MLPYPPLIFRSALIGLALAAVLTMVVLMPKRAGEPTLEDLPDRLFPMFTEEDVGEQIALPVDLIEITKSPNLKEVSPGSPVSFSLSVKNISENTLRNLTLEERFESGKLTVINAGGGGVTANRLAWQIVALRPNEQRTVHYTLKVKDDVGAEPLQTTAYLFGEDLKYMTSSSRMISANIDIITMPEAGVELGPFLRLISMILH